MSADGCGMKEATREPDKRMVYKTVGDVSLTMNIFVPTGHRACDGDPCIVFFHGGGWNGGNPSQFYPQCCHLSERGMVAMSAQYRVKDFHGTSPYECVADGKSAVRWIRQNADMLGVNPRKVAAGGGSAGGHVAAAAGSLVAFDEPCEDARISSRPGALVLFNPVLDNGPDGYGYDRVSDRWREFSPAHNISADTPPTIFFFGTDDRLMSASEAEAYRDAVIRAGVRCELFLYEGQKHGFFNYRDGNNLYYGRTIAETDRFLESLGYLQV